MADLITTEQLAAHLRVRPSTIRTWTRERLIPEIRITARVRRYVLEDVEAALRSLGGVAHSPECARAGEPR